MMHREQAGAIVAIMADPKWTRLVPVTDKIVPLLANALVGEALLDRLIAGKVVSRAHYDELLRHSQEPSRSQESVARRLLEILMRRPPPCFESFCAVLQEEDDADRKAIYELLVTSTGAHAHESARLPYENPAPEDKTPIRTRALGKEDSSNPKKALDCIAPTTDVAQTHESPRVSCEHSPAYQAYGGKCSDEASSDDDSSDDDSSDPQSAMLFIHVHESLRDEWESNRESFIHVVEAYCNKALPERKISVNFRYVSRMTFGRKRRPNVHISINHKECLLRIIFPETAPKVFKHYKKRLLKTMCNLLSISIKKIEIKTGCCIVDLTVTGKGFINFICGLHPSNFAHLIVFDSLAKLQIGCLLPVRLVALLRTEQLQSVSEAFSVLRKV